MAQAQARVRARVEKLGTERLLEVSSRPGHKARGWTARGRAPSALLRRLQRGPVRARGSAACRAARRRGGGGFWTARSSTRSRAISARRRPTSACCARATRVLARRAAPRAAAARGLRRAARAGGGAAGHPAARAWSTELAPRVQRRFRAGDARGLVAARLRYQSALVPRSASPRSCSSGWCAERRRDLGARRDLERAAHRRPRAASRRARGGRVRVAGAAARDRAGAQDRRRSSSSAASSATRRCCCSTTSRPSSTPPATRSCSSFCAGAVPGVHHHHPSRPRIAHRRTSRFSSS